MAVIIAVKDTDELKKMGELAPGTEVLFTETGQRVRILDKRVVIDVTEIITIGDLTEFLQHLKAREWKRDSVLYAVDRVWSD